jgi:putative ABC transport system permease protein
MNTMIIDFDFVDTYGLEIVQGRNISAEFSTDSTDAYLVNETAVRELMLENPIGSNHPGNRWT